MCTYTVCASAAVEVRASADGEKLFEMKRTASELETGTEYAANYHFENERLTMIHTNAIHLVLRKQDYNNEAVVRMEITDRQLVYNMVFDSKSRKSFFLRIPQNVTRSESKRFGNTYQFYVWVSLRK